MLGPILHKLGAMTLGTVDPASSISAVIRVQQLFENLSSDLLHRCSNRFLVGFQIQMPESLPITKGPFYGTLDFVFDLLPNCLNKVFFSVSSSSSSAMSRTARF